MKIIDDSKLYLWGGIISLVAAIFLGAVSYYSILKVEPEIKKLIQTQDSSGSSLAKAYILLREPQLFGGYENFDTEGYSIKNTLIFFDSMVFSTSKIVPGWEKHLQLLLSRRIKGSTLGRNSMFFALIVSMILWVSFFIEKKQLRANK